MGASKSRFSSRQASNVTIDNDTDGTRPPPYSIDYITRTPITTSTTATTTFSIITQEQQQPQQSSEAHESEDLPAWALIVVEYCGWCERAHLMTISKSCWRNANSEHFYKFLCRCLSEQNSVYIVPPLRFLQESDVSSLSHAAEKKNMLREWRAVFLSAYKLRYLWEPGHSLTTEQQQQNHPLTAMGEGEKIKVFARFRPKDEKPYLGREELGKNGRKRGKMAGENKKGGGETASTTTETTTIIAKSSVSFVCGADNDKQHSTESEGKQQKLLHEEGGKEGENEEVHSEKEGENEGVEVSLPLHQRLAMIKMSYNLKSNRAALHVLTKEGGWFQSKWAGPAQEAARNSIAVSQRSANSMAMAQKSGEENMANGQRGEENLGENGQYQQENQLKEKDGGTVARAPPMVLVFDKDGNSVQKNYSGSSSSFTINKTATASEEQKMGSRYSEKIASGSVISGSGTGNKIRASVQSLDAHTGRVVMVAPDVGLREFAFNAVLPPEASQERAYRTVAQKLVGDFLNGFNATTIVYGQTGSGKTYSMFGLQSESTRKSHQSGGKGIAPRAIEEIFQAIDTRRRVSGIESQLAVSYVEIFGDHVSDLLRSGARCGHSKVAAQRFVLNGAAEREVESIEDVERLLEEGDAVKRRAATAMNDRSSRAHALLILSLTQTKQKQGKKQEKQTQIQGNNKANAMYSAPQTILQRGENAGSLAKCEESTEETTGNGTITIKSRLFMADLGGSEQVSKSKVAAGALRAGTGQQIPGPLLPLPLAHTQHAQHQQANNPQFSVGFELGENMREAVYINLGLLALKKCIEALNNGAAYTPYQDSKLTMLLSEGLGGNCRTSILICARMDPSHVAETVATLRFGERCALVETTARNNASMLASVLAALDREIGLTEQKIREKERWEAVEETRRDELAETGTFEAAMGGVETKRVFVLVGAEGERKQLEQLLLQRARFTGSAALLEDEEEEEKEKGTGGFGYASANATGTVNNNNTKDTKQQQKKQKKVVGFGKKYAEIYGLGRQFVEETEGEEGNERFEDTVQDLSAVPATVRARGTVAWRTGEELREDDKKLEIRAKKAKRNKLAYSALSL